MPGRPIVPHRAGPVAPPGDHGLVRRPRAPRQGAHTPPARARTPSRPPARHRPRGARPRPAAPAQTRAPCAAPPPARQQPALGRGRRRPAESPSGPRRDLERDDHNDPKTVDVIARSHSGGQRDSTERANTSGRTRHANEWCRMSCCVPRERPSVRAFRDCRSPGPACPWDDACRAAPPPHRSTAAARPKHRRLERRCSRCARVHPGSARAYAA